jgi:magnesium transporter
MIYLSHLLGKTIIDSKEKNIGILEDLIILDGEKAAEVVAIVCKCKKGTFRIPIKFVEVIEHLIKLSVEEDRALQFGTVQPDDIRLKASLLDKQLIDTEGLKVIRVNDVALSMLNGKLSAIGVDSGIGGFMRRLGISSSITKALLDKKTNAKNIICWEFVAPLEPDSKHLNLKIERKSIHAMHPADIAEIMGDLSKEERVLVLKSLDDNVAADTLAEAEPEVQKSIVEDVKTKRITSILEKMTAYAHQQEKIRGAAFADKA